MVLILTDVLRREVEGIWDKSSAIRKPDGIPTSSSNNFVLTASGETILHFEAANGDVTFFEFLIEKLKRREANRIEGVKRALKMRNKDGDTPLHMAAALGNWGICYCIINENPSLLAERNNAGETPLFYAAQRGKEDAFLLLHDKAISVDPDHQLANSASRRTLDGDTILHCAISGEYFSLAYRILELYEHLVWYVNERGETPLHILARKPSAFRSGSHIVGWKSLIYNGLNVKELKPREYVTNDQINDRTGFNFIGIPMKFCRQVVNCFKKHAAAEADADTENPAERQTAFCTHESMAIEKLFRSFAAFCTRVSMAIEKLFRPFGMITTLQEEKKKHVWACQIVDKLLSSEKTYDPDSGANPTSKSVSDYYYDKDSTVRIPYEYDTAVARNINQVRNERPFFVAARHGITEMVEKQLQRDPMAIDYVDQDRKNILLVTIENRLIDVLDIVIKKCSQRPSALMAVDVKGNSALHLAAMLPENNPWPVPGATLQMQWEIKYFMYIKHLFRDYSLLHYNNDGKTPEDLFAETHKELVKNSIMWLTNTSQSCSVVAGLFVTVAFTTSTTLPGGARQETGTPYLENQPAFELFAISSQVAFYSSLFSVVVFLSILTSGYQMSDFDKALPRKLLLGLTALYVSIASTLMSFCSAHFFVLKAKLKQAASPVYVATCLLVTLFAISQFPLYFQLVWATFKKVPQRRSKKVIPQYLFF